VSDAVATAGAFDHGALLYRSLDELAGRAAAFAGPALEAGEPLLLVLAAEGAEAVRDALGPAAARAAFLDASEWYRSPGAVMSGFHRWLAQQEAAGGRAHAIGEPPWPWDYPPEAREWRRFEAQVNLAFAGRAARVLCAYDASALPGELAAWVRATHPVVAGERAGARGGYREPGESCRDVDAAPLEPRPADARARAFRGGVRQPRAFLRAALSRLGAEGDALEDLLLAGHELVANVIRHGAGRGWVAAWRAGTRVVVEVGDAGPGPDDPLLGCLPPAEADRGGWGVWLARQACDVLEARRTPAGFVIRMHRSLGGGA
jgi:anti-sigma regulatory factor (Ser/Thr protein kinase)